MRYEIWLHTWHGCDVWGGEFDSHSLMLAWYKQCKYIIEKENNDSIFKVEIKCFVN